MFGSFAATIARSVTGRAAGIVIDKLVDVGEGALVDAAGPFGGLVRSFLRQAEASDLQRTRLQRRIDDAARAARRATEAWRRDWRSQPRRPAGREDGGEWMEGRLNYMAEFKQPISRSKMRRRNRHKRQAIAALRAYKARRAALGDTKTRTIRTSWGDF